MTHRPPLALFQKIICLVAGSFPYDDYWDVDEEYEDYEDEEDDDTKVRGN